MIWLLKIYAVKTASAEGASGIFFRGYALANMRRVGVESPRTDQKVRFLETKKSYIVILSSLSYVVRCKNIDTKMGRKSGEKRKGDEKWRNFDRKNRKKIVVYVRAT